LTHQYKHLNESMAALTAATQALQQCVHVLQEQGGQSAAAGKASSRAGSWQQWMLGGGLSRANGLLLLAAGASVGVITTRALAHSTAAR
jgi:hypothetical protein